MSSLLSAGALIHYLHKSHNTSLLLPKNLHRHCFRLLLGHFHVPGEIANNGYANVLGGSRGVLWDCASSELTKIKTSVGFWVRGKLEIPEKDLSDKSREPTNSTHIIMTPILGIERGPHWWEASALTTMPAYA